MLKTHFVRDQYSATTDIYLQHVSNLIDLLTIWQS